MPGALFLDDLYVGQRFAAGPISVTAEEIVSFAREFDPQPFHLDGEAAKATLFQGLAASGWHTAALTMRMLTDGGIPIATGVVGVVGLPLLPQAATNAAAPSAAMKAGLRKSFTPLF